MKIVLQNLTKTFPGRGRKAQNDVTAVDDLSCEIPDGELIALLGPSGCGKSTTLNLLCGLENPTFGRIFFGEDDITDLPPELRGVGMVFQNYALYPHMTVRQNILFPMENLKGKERLSKEEMQKRAEETARLVQIEELMDRKPRELSGGQQQRVAIARALVKMPRVLLLDEPLSNLDARLRLQTREEIRKIQKKTGITTVFVTHDQDEAMSISDRIAVMRLGVLMQMGRPQEVYDNPANLFVACFIGTPQMNIFRAKLEKRGDAVYATFGNNAIKVPAGKVQRMTGDYIGKEVYMGIRPENIHDESAFISAYPDACIDVAVELIELMGSETYLYLSTSGKDENFIARVDPRTSSRGGDKIKVGFDVNRLHFFDVETEKTILSRD
mgnify:CR=1 FL=1